MIFFYNYLIKMKLNLNEQKNNNLFYYKKLLLSFNIICISYNFGINLILVKNE